MISDVWIRSVSHATICGMKWKISCIKINDLNQWFSTCWLWHTLVCYEMFTGVPKKSKIFFKFVIKINLTETRNFSKVQNEKKSLRTPVLYARKKSRSEVSIFLSSLLCIVTTDTDFHKALIDTLQTSWTFVHTHAGWCLCRSDKKLSIFPNDWKFFKMRAKSRRKKNNFSRKSIQLSFMMWKRL